MENQEINNAEIESDVEEVKVAEQSDDYEYVEDESEEGSEEEPVNNSTTYYVEDDELDEKKVKTSKSKVLYMMLPLLLVLVVIVFVVIFILGGKGNTQTAVVKDKTQPLLNPQSQQDNTDIGRDYEKKFETSNSNTNVSKPTPDPNMTVADSVTSIPPVITDAGSPFQIPITAVEPTSKTRKSQKKKNVSSSGISSGETVEDTDKIRPEKNTKIVEITDSNPEGNNYTYPKTRFGRNEQFSLYFYERDKITNSSRIQRIDRSKKEYRIAKPSFGTVLPVKILGRIHTLGTNGLARMELTRTVEDGWGSIPRGTLFVGRVSGGKGSRLFISLIGYIDDKTKSLVTLGGDVQGVDGALGVKGKQKNLKSKWKKLFGGLLSTAKEVGMAYLSGRNDRSGTVVNNGQIERIPNSLSENNKYTVVTAGTQCYVSITQLPAAVRPDSRLSNTQKRNLSDEEILQMIEGEDSTQIARNTLK